MLINETGWCGMVAQRLRKPPACGKARPRDGREGYPDEPFLAPIDAPNEADGSKYIGV